MSKKLKDQETTEIEISNETFAQFGLSEELLKAVKEIGYETPSPIQLKTIPILLEGRDIIGQAQTGTGKTASFSLPLLQNIDPKSKALQAIVLTPTRELAIQVAEAIHSYSKYVKNMRVLPIYGGQSMFQQIKHLRSGVQVVVGTPGRMMDHLRRETMILNELKIVVLDEADEMLRMGFIDDVEWILSHTPPERQTALFSATMPREVKRIADKHLNNAVNIEIERKTLTVPNIKQYYVNVVESQKTNMLTKLLEAEANETESILIFTRTKISCDQLVEKLRARGYSVEAMHGDMNQNQRETVIKKLKAGKLEIVAATDVAARGLDVDNIGLVINYDIPGDTESYVHRIGRTGRAGRSGKSILFVTPRQTRMKSDIERYTKQQIEPMKMPTQADILSRRIASLKEKITSSLAEQDLGLYLNLVEDFAEEIGCDIAEIAAAAISLVVGNKPLEVIPETPEMMRATKFEYSDEGMVKLLLTIGRKQNVSPADIVGAIANEGGIPGKVIGGIDLGDTFSLVDVPQEVVFQVLTRMKDTQIRGNLINIRLAKDNERVERSKPKARFGRSSEGFDPSRKRKPRGKFGSGDSPKRGGKRPKKR